MLKERASPDVKHKMYYYASQRRKLKSVFQP